MGEETMLDKIKHIIGKLAWPIFLWSISRTAKDYWDDIYRQELSERNTHEANKESK